MSTSVCLIADLPSCMECSTKEEAPWARYVHLSYDIVTSLARRYPVIPTPNHTTPRQKPPTCNLTASCAPPSHRPKPPPYSYHPHNISTWRLSPPSFHCPKTRLDDSDSSLPPCPHAPPPSPPSVPLLPLLNLHAAVEDPYYGKKSAVHRRISPLRSCRSGDPNRGISRHREWPDKELLRGKA